MLRLIWIATAADAVVVVVAAAVDVVVVDVVVVATMQIHDTKSITRPVVRNVENGRRQKRWMWQFKKNFKTI